MRVYILATCRKPELLPFSTLVFKTLRVGFPSAHVLVTINAPDEVLRSKVLAGMAGYGCDYFFKETIHHEWIEELIREQNEPFYICDTDVIFYNDFEIWTWDKPLAGYRIPEWRDAFAGAITRARLHTSLLYINPRQVRDAIAAYESGIASSRFTPKVNLFHPLVVPFKRGAYFYDTCSLLYHAIGGAAFTDEQKDSYCHINFGTIPDIVLPRLPEKEATDIYSRRHVILNSPQLGRGEWRSQDEYYANHPV